MVTRFLNNFDNRFAARIKFVKNALADISYDCGVNIKDSEPVFNTCSMRMCLRDGRQIGGIRNSWIMGW
jgi:hypothetical protein